MPSLEGLFKVQPWEALDSIEASFFVIAFEYESECERNVKSCKKQKLNE